MARRCSVCGHTSHDARRHRRNLDAFTDRHGIIHPIKWPSGQHAVRYYQTGYDYKPTIPERRKQQREREGLTSYEQQQAKRDKNAATVIYGRRRLAELDVERKQMRSDLRSDPVARLTTIFSQHGEAAERDLIPFSAARRVKDILGRPPEKFLDNARTKYKGKNYLKPAYVLDEAADMLGFRSDNELREAIDNRRNDKARLRSLDAEAERLREDIRKARMALKAKTAAHKAKAKAKKGKAKR